MDLQQKRILSENLDYFSKNINVERLQTKTRELYPKIISDADVMSLNMRKHDARVAYLLDLFKKEKDGYAKLYDVLKKTSQDTTVLKLMEPGKTSQTPVMPSPRKQTDGNEALLAAMQDMMSRQTMEMKKEMRNVTREEISKQLTEFKETVRRELNDLKQRMDGLAQLEAAISSGKTSQEEIKKVLTTLTQEFAKFKEDYKNLVDRFNQLEEKDKRQDANNFDAFLDKLKSLENLGKQAVWQEIRKLREELEVLRRWTEDSCGSMQKRLDGVEKGTSGVLVPRISRSRADVISESDIQYIAIKLGVYWEVIAKDVGIKGEAIKQSKGDGAKDDSAAAAALISEWLHRSGKGAEAPPTWGTLYEIVKRHDSKVAEEIDELRRIKEKSEKR